MIEIWHNPKCSKSRAALALLERSGQAPEVRLYLESPPDAKAIEHVLGLLDLEPRDLMRRSEAPYRELGLDDPAKTRQELIAAMAAHPILIERPVVIRGDRAALGRPPENVLALLDEE
jgi:arsenate reductase